MSRYKKIIFLTITSLYIKGCNYRFIDFHYTYEYAIIQLPNGSIVEGEVESWHDSKGDSVCIRIDGVDYYTTTNNAVLFSKDPN